MGQKIHPVGLRVGVIRDWEGRWFAEKDYATLLHEDLKIRRFIKSRLYNAGIARVEIERAANRVKVTIHTARPGMVIGRGGTEVENLRKSLEKLTDKQVSLNIAEVKVPDLNAQLVAENICFTERRSFTVGDETAISRVMRRVPWASRLNVVAV